MRGPSRTLTDSLLRRSGRTAGPDVKWYDDGTEIPAGEGKLHLASVLDVASRRVLGFALSEHHDAELAYGALAMAVDVPAGPALTSETTAAPRGRKHGQAPACPAPGAARPVRPCPPRQGTPGTR